MPFYNEDVDEYNFVFTTQKMKITRNKSDERTESMDRLEFLWSPTQIATVLFSLNPIPYSRIKESEK